MKGLWWKALLGLLAVFLGAMLWKHLSEQRQAAQNPWGPR